MSPLPSVRSSVLPVLSLSLLTLSACGYHPVHGAADPAARCEVRLRSSLVPDPAVADEVVAGVRDALADANVLGDARATSRCEVEVLRIDETSEGIVAGAATDGTLSPTSRATRLGVVGRAQRVRRDTEDLERDTGDVRVFETTRVADGARAATLQYDATLRAAARRLGRRLGAAFTGAPAPSED